MAVTYRVTAISEPALPGTGRAAVVRTAGTAGLVASAQGMEARQGRDAWARSAVDWRLDAQRDSPAPRTGVRHWTGH